MPPRYNHIFSEGANAIHPLFIVFPETPERIKKGLQGANLPFVPQVITADREEVAEFSRESPTV